MGDYLGLNQHTLVSRPSLNNGISARVCGKQFTQLQPAGGDSHVKELDRPYSNA